MGRRSIRLCLLLLTLALFLLMLSAQNGHASQEIGAAAISVSADVIMSAKLFATSNTTISSEPVFQSSFIQYWYSENFDSNRWNQELVMLKKLGINEIILQTTADTKAKYAVYPTKLSGYTHNDVDMLENVLAEADKLSMNVRVGIGFNEEWWNKGAGDMEWLNNEAAVNKAIIDEVAKMYGNHPSLSGWYIPHEFYQFTAITGGQQSNLNSFFKQLASEIELKSPGKDIMISPFYYGRLSSEILMPVWSSMISNIIRGTGVDILALQDSVGVDYNTEDKLKDLYSYTKKGTDEAGVKLYSVTETFTATPQGNIPVTQDKISEQLSIVKPFVEGYAAFSINHFQNSNEPSQSSNYNQYYEYYLSNQQASSHQ